jgi:hypothetical protein
MMHRAAIAGVAALAMLACARATQFDRYWASEQWPEAARVFTDDSTLRNDENSLYRAGVLFGTPGRTTYDPVRARDLLSSFLSRFPKSPRRIDATAHLLLIEDILKSQRDSASRQRDVEARIASLTRETHDLRIRVDSMVVQNDSVRAVVTKLEADRRDKEEQLRVLRLELQALKEADLKPRKPPDREF